LPGWRSPRRKGSRISRPSSSRALSTASSTWASVALSPLAHEALPGQRDCVAHRAGLAGIDELLQTPQVDALGSEDEQVDGFRIDLYLAPAAGGVQALRDGNATGHRCEGAPRLDATPRLVRLGDRLRLRGHVGGQVLSHLDDGIGDVEVVAAAAHHQHRGDAQALVELAHPVHEGRDRLVVFVHQFLHARVPDHEVGRRGVLVQEQGRRTHLEGLDDVGCLAGASARVVAGETPGTASSREVRKCWSEPR
jgi:hypothetical protein